MSNIVLFFFILFDYTSACECFLLRAQRFIKLQSTNVSSVTFRYQVLEQTIHEKFHSREKHLFKLLTELFNCYF